MFTSHNDLVWCMVGVYESKVGLLKRLPMNIALLGHGTVGRGVDGIIRACVPEVEVTRILELPDRLSDPRMTSDYADIVNNSSIDLVVECMGA